MEQDRSNTMEALLKTLNNILKSPYNEAIKSLHFHKLHRQMNENAEEWMGRLRLAAIECNYKEIDRQLMDQFIHGLNDNDILVEIIRELTKDEDSTSVTSEQV